MNQKLVAELTWIFKRHHDVRIAIASDAAADKGLHESDMQALHFSRSLEAVRQGEVAGAAAAAVQTAAMHCRNRMPASLRQRRSTSA